jgi:hypothetical protein
MGAKNVPGSPFKSGKKMAGENDLASRLARRRLEGAPNRSPFFDACTCLMWLKLYQARGTLSGPAMALAPPLR